MTVTEILDQLKSLTNEKMFAHNIKYGATRDNQFGVKMGDIKALAKKIKTDHALGSELWKTHIIEAQLLACLIIDPGKLSVQDLDEMVKSTEAAQVADWFNMYTIKEYPKRDELLELWLNSGNKWAARSGWSILAGKIAKGAQGLNLDQLLDKIEKEMPSASPEVQWTMNTALANAGIYHASHRQRAIEIGNKLGVYKDFHVSKGCTSPFAPIWINEMVKRMK